MSDSGVTELLAELSGRHISLTADGDRLRCRAPEGTLTRDLLAAITARKSELLAHLRAAHRVPRHEGPAPLSFAQERLWLLHQFHPRDSAYNLPLEIALRGPLSPAALRDCLGQVLRRHEVLRTRYAISRGRPLPVVAPFHGAPPLPLADLGALPGPARATALARLAAQEARRPFTLATGPVLRALLVRLAPGEHRLLLTRHHIAGDGWSLDLLLRDLGTLYRAHLAGTPGGLPDPPLRYTDFAAWQREQAARPEAAASSARWAERLAGAPPGLDLLAPPPAEPGYEPAAVLRDTLPPDLLTGLRALGGRAGLTLFPLLLAAFGLTLAALSGQDDTVVGVPVAGRGRTELEPLVGCFATVAPIRLPGAGAAPLTALAADAQQQVREALEGPDVPFERLVEALRPERSLTDNPLFSASFAFQNTPRTAVDLPGLDVAVLPPPAVAPKFPLALTATEGPDGIALELEHDPGRLTGAVAGEILTRLREILTGTLAAPDAPTAAVLHRATARRLPRPRHEERTGQDLLHHLVARAAARHPDAVAVTCGGAQLTYGALDTRAGRLAAVLRSHGAGPEHLVGLCLPAGPQWAVGALAVLKAGAAYLPLDPADPAARRAAVAADAGITLIVSDTELPPLRRVDPAATAPPGTPAAPARPVRPANAAYAVYTSGSTGGPKGVLVTHANITGLLASCRETLPALDAPRTWSMTHSPAFDFSVWEVWGALTTGGRLVMVPPDVARAPDELWTTLQEERVEVLSQTPSAFHQLLPTAVRATPPGALELVVLGGERCEPGRLGPWWDAVGDRRPAVFNLYGITETTVHVTARRLTAADTAGSPVGAPLPGQYADVLDPAGRPAGPGGRGEMFVGGVGLARGYLNRPGLTADRFPPDDTPGRTGARRYRSGDLARLLPGGELDYLGRSDAQVKLRGHRVEPAETEAAALTHPAVRDCAVVARTDGDRHYLAAYAVLDGTCDAGALRAYLAARLPRYLVPAAVVPLDRIPLTRNGKLDRAALPDPAAGRAARPPDRRARTATERTLARLLADLLKTSPETIGVHDNLFDLGGDSLMVTQFHSRVVEEFDVDLPVRRVYQALDIAALATTVEDFRARADRQAILSALAEVEALPPEPSGPPVWEGEPCSE
ncbi:amino acid adenylation domain-containing protein [Streptomyces sp. NPDC046215]|uniref:amino acid adenylation domain-containing protein n=1 Tax=Streptomyces sp. NPDC046215 TaxID=3155774 RepID=UPI0033C2A5F9